MISVCMAAKNGARFIGYQLDSILPQLNDEDEIIISDDHSTDNTFEIVKQYSDARIRFIENPKNGIVSNFENSLLSSKGEIIFLADQDDVWMPDKIKQTLPYFHEYDLVVSDCKIVDDKLNCLHDSFFEFNTSGKGVVKNLFRNSYMGCCMTFKRSLLKKALPFPSRLIIHDQWLGLIGELYGKAIFHPEKLVLHRRHNKNASTTFYKSNYDFMRKFSYRLKLALSLIETRYGN